MLCCYKKKLSNYLIQFTFSDLYAMLITSVLKIVNFEYFFLHLFYDVDHFSVENRQI